MNELELVRLIHARAPRPHGGVVLGIGDDCAVFRPGGRREDLLFTTDMLIEGVHFLREAHPAEAVGWRALARGLSDIAAMGGRPRFCLLSLALAPWTDRPWQDAYFRGFLRLALQAGATLVGGDLGHAERVMCDVVVCGSAPQGKWLRRDGARPGDGIYVSGSLGASALGLRKRRGAAWRQHLWPEPRLELGRLLRTRLKATAAMDLSDGLSLDLHRLCRASRVAAELDDVPIFRGATPEDALHGGEDYELLFTLRPRTRVPARLAGLELTRIGTIVKGKPGAVLLAGRPLPPRGYDHFGG
jgi:thiamine-monophosphate kinase